MAHYFSVLVFLMLVISVERCYSQYDSVYSDRKKKQVPYSSIDENIHTGYYLQMEALRSSVSVASAAKEISFRLARAGVNNQLFLEYGVGYYQKNVKEEYLAINHNSIQWGQFLGGGFRYLIPLSPSKTDNLSIGLTYRYSFLRYQFYSIQEDLYYDDPSRTLGMQSFKKVSVPIVCLELGLPTLFVDRFYFDFSIHLRSVNFQDPSYPYSDIYIPGFGFNETNGKLGIRLLIGYQVFSLFKDRS